MNRLKQIIINNNKINLIIKEKNEKIEELENNIITYNRNLEDIYLDKINKKIDESLYKI